MKITNNMPDLKQWVQFTLLFILFFAFNKTYAQYEEHECFVDTSSQDTSEMAFVSSIYGKNFTPKGEFRIILVFAGFTNDGNTDNTGNWPYDDGINPPGKSFPTNVNDYFYSNYNQFSPTNNDNTISNYFYQMSLPNGTPLKMVADVFPERINVTADIALDTSGQAGWDTYNQWVLDSIAINHPNFDWSPYDNRKNNPGNSFDNSDVINHPPDSIIDFLVILWRYGKDCPNDPNYINPITQQPYLSTLCKNPHSNVAVANIPDNKTFTDSLGRTYKTARYCGFRSHKVLKGISRSLFLHEVAHNLYGSPHYNGANGVVGRQFYNNFGYGIMKPGDGPHVYESANGWERWHLGWIELTTDSNQVNTQLDSIGDIQNGGIYTLRDFITTGDVIRVRIPQPYGEDQYLWLENHQGKSTFDNREGWVLNGVNDTFPDAPRGLVAYVEKMGSRDFNLSPGNANKVNGIKYLNNNGHYDYTNQYASPEPSAPEVWGGITYNFIKGTENPLSPHTSTSFIRNDFIPNNNKIDYHGNWNNNTSNNIQNEQRIVYKENGSFTYGALGIGMTFNQGDKIGLSSNPVITNIQWFQSTFDTLSSIFLTGISFEVLSYNQDSSLTVKIRMDDYDIENNTRYTGSIILPANIVSPNNYSFNIKTGKVLDIDKSGTPNKQNITANNDFINPTVFTCSGGSYFHLEQNASLYITGNSTLVLKSGSKLELEDGAELFIHQGELIIEDGAELILHDGAKLTVDIDGKLTINNTTTGKGLVVGDNTVTSNQAEVVINGTLTFASNAIWEHKKSGFYNFASTHTLNLPSTVGVTFTGLLKTHKMLELQNSCQLSFSGNTINWSKGLIHYGLSAQVNLTNADYSGTILTFTGPTNSQPGNIGLNVDNPTKINVFNSTIEKLHTGIKISNATVTGMLLGNTYIDNTVSIDLNQTTNTVIAQSSISTSYPGGIGIKAVASFQVTISATTIIGLDKGAYFNDVDAAYFNNNSNISYATVGIEAENTLLFIRGQSEIHQNTKGVSIFGSYNYTTNNYSSMLTVGDAGCGAIYDNAIGVYGRDAILNIDAIEHSINSSGSDTIPNRFDNNSTYTFDICYTDYTVAPSQINAKMNYWGGTVIPTSNYRLKTNTDCIAKPNHGTNIPLITSPHSTCTPTPNCANCAMTGGGGTSPGGPIGGLGLMVINAFQTANEPFVEEDNLTTREGFTDISSVGLLKDTTNQTWQAVTINNNLLSIDKNSVHRIQVAKAIKAKATNSNMRLVTAPKDIFAGVTQNANELSAKIQVYPNPVSNELNISHDLSVKEGAIHLEIMDVMGRVLINKTINHTNNQIDINQLSSGLYFYNVLQNDKVVQSGKLVVE